MRAYIIFILILFIEMGTLYIIQNSLYYFMLMMIFIIADGVLAFILFNSITLSILSMPTFFAIYSIFFKLDFYETILLISYYAPYYFIISLFIFFLYSLVKRNFYDFLWDELRKNKISFSPLKLAISMIISILLYWYLYYNPFLLVGSILAGITLSLYGSNYELPLVTLSWIIFPYLVIPKNSITSKNGIIIGKIIGKLGKATAVDTVFLTSDPNYKWIRYNSMYYLDFSFSKNYNVIILGTSGVGKSTLAKKILNSLNVSYLVFDVHGEYEINNAKRIDASQITINPLSLFGRSPKERALEISLMLKSLFNLGNIQTMELTNLILEAYAEKGIDEDNQTSWSNTPPTFRDVLLLLEKKKKLATTTQDLSKYQSIEPYIQFLTSSIFSNSNIDLSNIFKENFIIDFSKVPTNEIKYIIIETLLKSIQSFMYISGISKLKKIIVIDEAPFILSKESGKNLIERLFAEGRKFGFGFILISQTSEYIKELINNSSYIFVFNLIDPKELDYASKLIGGYDSHIYSAIYETLQKLPRGLCVTRDLLRGDLYLLNLAYGDL
ncbi:ATP-binding protein [Sulfurisphaera javensis]|uniref:ATP-binding protein n=1 Tax=Sulfurisphaera javensis TaxID=2049879 RepID=A0AAT9GRL5_9CREN